MATKRPTLLQEAADPATDPERLGELANIIGDETVRRAAWKNPSLPEDIWREALLNGWPEPWANPMASIYLLTWTPREDDVPLFEQGARFAMLSLWREPNRISSEGKALLNAKVQELWATSEEPGYMMNLLGGWAKANSNGSQEHREVVRLLVLCTRTSIGLTAKDYKALDLLEAWCAGGADRRKEAQDVAVSSWAVQLVTDFAQDLVNDPGNVIYEVAKNVAFSSQKKEYSKAKTEHLSLLADLIRLEVPLPPRVD